MKGRHLYSYAGPVYSFEGIINHKWVGRTVAPTHSKALSNLAYQYKKTFGKSVNFKARLLPEFLVDNGAWYN